MLGSDSAEVSLRLTLSTLPKGLKGPRRDFVSSYWGKDALVGEEIDTTNGREAELL